MVFDADGVGVVALETAIDRVTDEEIEVDTELVLVAE